MGNDRGLVGRRPVATAALALAAVGCALGIGVLFAVSTNHSATTVTGIREGIRRYLREPAVVYPICVSRTDPAYAKAGVYPLPTDYSLPIQVALHRSGSAWLVVAWRDYDRLGWLVVRGYPYPKDAVHEPWCHSVPHTPASIRVALVKRLTTVSTFGLTSAYVPQIGPPLYKPRALGFSGDGAPSITSANGSRTGSSLRERAQPGTTTRANPTAPQMSTTPGSRSS